MRIFTLTILLGFSLSFNAYAIDDSLENRIAEYERFKLTQNDDKQSAEAVRQILKSSIQNIFGRDVKTSGIEFKKFVEFIVENQTSLLDDKELNEKVNREVYTTLFTADEIHEIANFFGSSAGKNYQSKALVMMQMSMEKARQYLAEKGGKPSLLKVIENYLSSHPKLIEEIYSDQKVTR